MARFPKPLTTRDTKVHEEVVETEAFVVLRALRGSCILWVASRETDPLPRSVPIRRSLPFFALFADPLCELCG